MLVKGPHEVTRALKWMEVDAALQQGAKLYVRAPVVLSSEALVASDESIDLILLDREDLLQGVRNKAGAIIRR